MTDRELLDGLREGDEDAFATLFHTHYPQLVSVAERMLGDRGRAEEIVQDVLLELWRRRASLVVEATLRAYLFRATRNRALNEIRHEKVRTRTAPWAGSDPVVAPRGMRGLVEEEIEAALQAAVADLPDRCREVFELSRVHGLKYAEIATAMGISVKTVEAQMGKALRILRERLAPWLPGGREG